MASFTQTKHDPTLHWDPLIERRGLGNAIVRVNHIALIVEDVGRSSTFYSDVLGLQQIKRPNFDRHGAWFTMGNVELHLTKGIPLVHDGTNLIVCHISVEVEDPQVVFKRLKEMNIPFEQNISVPRGVGKAASEGGLENLDNTLTQFFLRDPDGYYIEICNCGILTDFCLGKNENQFTEYAEGVSATMYSFTAGVKLTCLARRARHFLANRRALEETIAAAKPAEVPNEIILNNFIKRRLVYGDICQSFSADELKDVLLQSGNSAPISIAIMQAKLKERQQKKVFVPPVYFRHNSRETGELFNPQAFQV